MKIRLLSVGKPREVVLSRLHDRYAERLVRLGVQYETDHVSDVPAGRHYAAEHALEREARSLFERIPWKSLRPPNRTRRSCATS